MKKSFTSSHKCATLPAVFLVLLLSCCNSALAAIPFTVGAHLSWELFFPVDVAVSPGNEIFVVDADNNQISIYDFDYQHLGSFAIESPTAVAVADNGSIYAASTSTYSVAILDGSGQVLDYLGDGSDEFLLPRNIAIDESTGSVYVVDQLAESVKVYSADGTYLSRIDDTGNLPQDVAIVGQELFVIDQPLIPDAYGGLMRGARIQVFALDGTPVRSFGSYGTGSGQLVRPSGIVSDSDGVLYVSDAFHGAVLCFDVTGTYLGALEDAADPMLAPLGLDIDTYGRLVVASSLSPNVRIFMLSDLLNDCAGIVDPEQLDSDGDGIWNICDNCSSVANIEQGDGNGNGVGDVCEQQGPWPVSFLNAPHDRAHNVTCVDCHAHPLPDTGRSTVCTTCHDGLDSQVPSMAAHTNTECLDCHDPHFQRQFAHLPSDGLDLFLGWGVITGVSVSSGATSTRVSYTPDYVKAGWSLSDPDIDWAVKRGVGRGLIFVVDRHHPGETFEIVSATAGELILQGAMAQETVNRINGLIADPDLDAEFGIIYGQMLRTEVRVPGGGTRPVKFFDAKDSFIDERITTSPEGLCQVCHTQTNYYLNDGGGQVHETGNCSDCHVPATGLL